MEDKKTGIERLPAFLLILLVAACSGTSKDRLLRFLFDEPPAVQKRDSSYVIPGDVEKQLLRDSGGPPMRPAVEYVVHPPYEEKECGVCHELTTSKTFNQGILMESEAPLEKERYGSRLRFSAEEVCYECHDDKTLEALEEQGEFLHGPAAAGECVICHDPHKSRYKALLKEGEPVSKLCFICHDEEDVISSQAHRDFEEEACTSCHDPHAASKEFLIKP